VTWDGGGSQAPTAITDTSGNAYQSVPLALSVPASLTGASVGPSQAIYYSSGIASASSNTVTATWTSTVTGTSLQVFEYSGIDTTSSTVPLDGYAQNYGTGSSADGDTVSRKKPGRAARLDPYYSRGRACAGAWTCADGGEGTASWACVTAACTRAAAVRANCRWD
jgi:hypothetical protein